MFASSLKFEIDVVLILRTNFGLKSFVSFKLCAYFVTYHILPVFTDDGIFNQLVTSSTNIAQFFFERATYFSPGLNITMLQVSLIPLKISGVIII